ncbi:MAG: rod shape-determining protein MreD [Candidatus Aminicenantes bacterium]|nr:MAG: rod shape-determining protein MreD [Candidatus Aminicenantes bacterium]
MKTFIKISAGIIAAFIFNIILGKLFFSPAPLFNFFSLVIIYFALARGEILGACLGTFCGLIHDAFSLGVFGFSGLSKTITGFLAGYISILIDVSSPLRIFIFIFILIFIELILWFFLYSFVFSERPHIGGGWIFFQPLATAFLGVFLFRFFRKFKIANP